MMKTLATLRLMRYLVGLGLACASCSIPDAPSRRGVLGQCVNFSELAGWKYVDGLVGMPPEILDLSGKRVSIVGRLIPVEALEATLVAPGGTERQVGGLETNEYVHVTLPRRLPSLDRVYAVKICGLFTVGPTVRDGYCIDIYQLEADSYEILAPAAPEDSAR